MFADDLLDRLGVACGQCALAAAKYTVMDDHITEQVDEHRNGAKDIHKLFPPSGFKKPSLL